LSSFLSKQIVEMMQGSISVKSQVGEGGGTTMTIRLPLPTAPADSSSGEVSQNSHTSSNGNKHSRSQQDLLMFKKGGGSTTQQTEDSSKHSGNQQDAAGHNNNSPPLRPHLVQIRTQQSIGSSLGAGAVTPQSVYSTMESQSRSLQSTPPHLHRQALPGSTLLGHREISAPFMSANSSSVLPSRTLATSGQRNNSAGGNGAEDAQSSTVAASSTQAPNGTEQGRSPSNTSMNDPTRAAMLRNSAADAARAASPPNGEGTQVHDLDSLNLGLGLGLSQQEVSPEPELTTYQQMSSPHEVQERLLAAHSQSPPTTTDGASSSRPAGGLHPSSIHLNIAAVESEARQATGAAAGGSGGASGGESGYSSGATPIDVMGRLAALAALPTTAKAEETTFAPSSGGSLQQAQVQSAIGETEPAGAVASAFTTASSSSSSSSTTVASSTSVGAGAETTTKPLKVPRASAKQAAASAVKEKEQTAATVAAMSLLPASEQAANSLLGSMGSTAPRTPPVAVYPRDLRILIADDSPTNLKILARMLQGFNVTQAVNGADAVEKVRELILADPPLQPYTPGEIDQRQLSNGGGGVDEQGTGLAQQVSPVSETNPNGQFTIGFSPLPQRDYVKRKDRQFDVIFSDVVMPVMDGQTAAREIRKLERLYHLPPAPITALTANAFLEDRDKCAAAGMSHFIAKPFTKQNILAIVQLVCQQQNMQLQLSSPHTPATQKREMKAAQSSFSLNRPGSADNSPASNVSILSGPSVNSSSSSTGSLATTRAPSTSGSSRGSFTKTDAAGASQTVPISVRALSGASPATSVSSGLPPLTPNVMATPNSGNGAASSTVLSRSGSQDPLMSPASGQLTQ
jgi:CheY-like chemotaxis protein